MTIRTYVLLGGLTGHDGAYVSRGMIDLAKRLPGVATTHEWGNYQDVITDIKSEPASSPVRARVLIGYSGGGFAATVVASSVYPRLIQEVILYDPSPASAMRSLMKNVGKALCYHNLNPGWPFSWLGIGGAMVTGACPIERVDVSENHLSVQYDENLHQRTLLEYARVLVP